MARIGNWDVTLSKQGWFDTVDGDPLNGWFDYTAIGATSSDIDLAPPGIPSAEQQALPKVIQIVSAPGVGISSSEKVAPAFVAQLIMPPGIESAETPAPLEAAIVIRPAGIASAEAVAPTEILAPPPPPTATGAHGGLPPPPPPPVTRARRPRDEDDDDLDGFAVLGQPSPPPGWTETQPWPSEEQFRARVYPWLDGDAFANDNDYTSPSPPPNVHVLDRFGPLKALPEAEFLVAGTVSEDPWKWILVGAAAATAVGIAAHYMSKNSKPTRSLAPRAKKKVTRSR